MKTFCGVSVLTSEQGLDIMSEWVDFNYNMVAFDSFMVASFRLAQPVTD